MIHRMMIPEFDDKKGPTVDPSIEDTKPLTEFNETPEETEEDDDSDFDEDEDEDTEEEDEDETFDEDDAESDADPDEDDGFVPSPDPAV